MDCIRATADKVTGICAPKLQFNLRDCIRFKLRFAVECHSDVREERPLCGVFLVVRFVALAVEFAVQGGDSSSCNGSSMQDIFRNPHTNFQ